MKSAFGKDEADEPVSTGWRIGAAIFGAILVIGGSLAQLYAHGW